MDGRGSGCRPLRPRFKAGATRWGYPLWNEIGVAGFAPAISCFRSRRDNWASLHPENGGDIGSRTRFSTGLQPATDLTGPVVMNGWEWGPRTRLPPGSEPGARPHVLTPSGMVDRPGTAPGASRLSVWRSNCMSYRSMKMAGPHGTAPCSPG